MTRDCSFIPRFAAIVALCFVLACSAEPALPGPGTVLATLVGPAEEGEGGAVIELFGSGIQSIEGVQRTQAFSCLNESGARVVLINQEGDLLMFLIALADTLQTPDVAIVEVAGPADALRTDLSQYKVEFTR